MSGDKMSELIGGVSVIPPSTPFTMPRAFKAISNGIIYIGKPDTDPYLNQIPVYLVNESGSRVEISQPLRTNAGGHITYNGQVAKIATISRYSILVKDSFGAQLWYDPDCAGGPINSGDYNVYNIPAGVTQMGEFFDNEREIIGVDLPQVPVSGISIDPVSKIVTLNMSTTAHGLTQGAYAFVTGDLKISGCHKVTSVSGSSVVISLAYFSSNTSISSGALAKPIISIIKPLNANGLELHGVTKNLKNVVVDASGMSYGINCGTRYEPGAGKRTGSIQNAEFASVDGGSISSWCIGGSGSSLGVNQVSASNGGIGFLSVYAGSVVGTGAYVSNSNEDSFKCEHSSAMYINTHNVLRTKNQSGYGSRYSSSQEMANGYITTPQLSYGTSQFNSYLSIRDVNVEGAATFAINSVDGGEIVLNNFNGSINSGIAFRCVNGSQIRSVGVNSTITGYSSFSEIVSSNLQLNNTIFSGKYIRASIVVGTIPASSRFSQQRTATGYLLSSGIPLNLTILQDMPIGIITEVNAISDNLVRVTFQNITASSIAVGNVDTLLSW